MRLTTICIPLFILKFLLKTNQTIAKKRRKQDE